MTFNFTLSRLFSKNRHPGKHHCFLSLLLLLLLLLFSPQKLVCLFPLKKVKRSPDVFATRTLFLKFVVE